jgi:hypothetical protein
MSAWPASMAPISVPGLTCRILASVPIFSPAFSSIRLGTLKLVLGSGEVTMVSPLNCLGSPIGWRFFETPK